MALKKILAIILCVAAVLSVMTIMGFATQGMREFNAASDAGPPPPSSEWWETTTQAPGASTTSWNPGDTWNRIKDTWDGAKGAYNDFILFWQKILLAGLKFLQFITGGFAFLRPSS